MICIDSRLYVCEKKGKRRRGTRRIDADAMTEIEMIEVKVEIEDSKRYTYYLSIYCTRDEIIKRIYKFVTRLNERWV